MDYIPAPEAPAVEIPAPAFGPDIQREKDRRQAARWEIAYQVLNVLDGVTTVDCLRRNVCQEGNPIFGKNPSTGQVIGIKAATGIVHWLVFAHLRDRNPRFAKAFAKVSVIVQGGAVAANLRFAF